MKQPIQIVSLVSLIATLLTSCASTRSYYPQTMSSWQNGNTKNLVNPWGTQDQIKTPPKTNGYINDTRTYSPNVGVNVNGGRPVIVSSPPNPK